VPGDGRRAGVHAVFPGAAQLSHRPVLAVVFVGVHVGSILFDSYVHFGLISVLVPFTGSWHPAAVAAGIVAFYLLLAVELTSLLRARLPLKLWRSSHYLSLPLFAFAILHGLTAGTDRHSQLLLGLYIAIVVCFLPLLSLRVWTTLQRTGDQTANQLGAPSR
jgi:methionine sulfoxide reductase heme-binding subunit